MATQKQDNFDKNKTNLKMRSQLNMDTQKQDNFDKYKTNLKIRSQLNMATKTRQHIGLIITNYQNMYICDISLFLPYLTPFEQICLSFLVF